MARPIRTEARVYRRRLGALHYLGQRVARSGLRHLKLVAAMSPRCGVEMFADRFLYLSRQDVRTIGVSMEQIIVALEKVFREQGEGRVEMPPKPGIHPGGGDNFIHAMPAYIPALASAGIKWVSGYPQNSRRGLPYITGLVILNDPDTGLPVAVMDCEWITAKRTGAATAVAARRLARPESSRVGILACGVQGWTNLEALAVVFPLRRVLAYDIDSQAATRLADKARQRLALEVEIVSSPRAAVSGSDLVVTSGPILKRPHATIQPGWLEHGAFASLVDFDSYWHRDALTEIDKLCTDDLAQLDYYRRQGYFQHLPPLHAELGELVTERKPGRETAEERTAAVNLGLALEDMAVAALIYERALASELGTWLPR